MMHMLIESICICLASVDPLITTLMKCVDAMGEVSLMDQFLIESGFVSDNRFDGRSLIELECKMLDLAATPGLCSDVFYSLLYKINNSQYIARYYEGGSLNGFFRARARVLLTNSIGENCILPYRFVYYNAYNVCNVATI